MRSERIPSGTVFIDIEFGQWTWVHEGGSEGFTKFSIHGYTVSRVDTSSYRPTRLLTRLLDTLAQSDAGVTTVVSYDRHSLRLTVPDPNKVPRAIRQIRRGLKPENGLAVRVPELIIAFRQ